MSGPSAHPAGATGTPGAGLRADLSAMARRLRARPPLTRLAMAGLIGFVLAAPFSISVSQLFVFTAVGLWLVSVSRERPISSVRFPFWQAFSLFAFLTAASAVNSAEPWASISNAQEVFQILIFYLALNIVHDDWEALWLVRALLAATAVACLYTLAVAASAPIGLANRMSGFFSIYMTLGGFLVVAGALALAYALLSERGSAWAYGVAILILATAMTTFSRNAWVGLGVAFVVIAAAGRSRRAGLFLAVLLVLAFFLAPQSLRDRVRSIADPKDPTTVERVYMWESGLQMVRERPWLGFGPGQIKKNYDRYANPKAIKKYTGHLHNNLLNIAAERGLLALAAWVWVFVAFFVQAGRRLGRAGGGGIARRIRGVGGVAAVAGFLAAGLFEYNFGDSEVSMIMYFAMALPFMGWHHEQRPAPGTASGP